MKRLIIGSAALIGSASLLLLSRNRAVSNVSGSGSASSILSALNGDSSIIDSLVNDQVGNRVELRYFKPSEFGGWYDQVSPKLLKMLDEFRHQWGFPVMISPHKDGVGREDAESTSQHNVLRWGEVRAVDVFPRNSVGGYINSPAELRRAYEIAKRVGFTGVGVYTDTRPGFMLHLDVREAAFAKWARIDGKYKAVTEAFA